MNMWRSWERNTKLEAHIGTLYRVFINFCGRRVLNNEQTLTTHQFVLFRLAIKSPKTGTMLRANGCQYLGPAGF